MPDDQNASTTIHSQLSHIPVCTHIRAVAFSQVVREVVLYFADELLGVLWVESEDLAEALEADILQVTVGQSLDVGVGLNHLLLCQRVRTNQISFTWGGAPTQRHVRQIHTNAERCADTFMPFNVYSVWYLLHVVNGGLDTCKPLSWSPLV